MPMFQSRGPKKSGGVWWDVLKLELGKQWRGWMAGPAIGVDCHFVEGARKACRHSFTDGKEPCAYCDSAIPPRFTGYVPLWCAEGRRHLLIMGERHWPAVETLPALTPITCSKTRSRGQAIYCGRSRWTDQLPPVVGGDQEPADITPHLLTMWGDQVLKDWCLARRVEQVAEVPAAPAKPPKKSVVIDPSWPESLDDVAGGRIGALVAENAARAAGNERLAERFVRILKEPSPNGSHKKPKPR